MVAEVDHRVSKEASDDFFKIGLKWFPILHEAKIREGVSTKTPQFTHIRRTLHKKKVPPIHLEIGYKHKVTGEVIVVEDECTPKSRFPPQQYEKTHEIASVKVGISEFHKNLFCILQFFFLLFSACFHSPPSLHIYFLLWFNGNPT